MLYAAVLLKQSHEILVDFLSPADGRFLVTVERISLNLVIYVQHKAAEDIGGNDCPVFVQPVREYRPEDGEIGLGNGLSTPIMLIHRIFSEMPEEIRGYFPQRLRHHGIRAGENGDFQVRGTIRETYECFRKQEHLASGTDGIYFRIDIHGTRTGSTEENSPATDFHRFIRA